MSPQNVFEFEPPVDVWLIHLVLCFYLIVNFLLIFRALKLFVYSGFQTIKRLVDGLDSFVYGVAVHHSVSLFLVNFVRLDGLFVKLHQFDNG